MLKRIKKFYVSFLIQFYVLFKIISAHMRQANQQVWRKRENPEPSTPPPPPKKKTPGTPASRTWLVSHVPRVEVEPTPDTVKLNPHQTQ